MISAAKRPIICNYSRLTPVRHRSISRVRVLSIVEAVIDIVAFIGRLIGLVGFAARLRRWWNDEAEPED